MYHNCYNKNRNCYDMRQIDLDNIISDIELIDEITKAAIEEAQAYNFYQRLADLATNEQQRQAILEIQRDEAIHYRWFITFLRRLGVQELNIPAVELPTELETGLKILINHELNAASFYENISYEATSRPVALHFLHASHDEKRHASALQTMLTNLQSKNKSSLPNNLSAT
jgi:rubrerythrin